MLRQKLLLLLLLLISTKTLLAQNPLVTHMFTADPTARVFDGKLYIYPSHDIVPPKNVKAPRFCMPDYHIFSLEEGITLKDHGPILDQNEVPWGKKNTYGMWAPDCIKKENMYYYYYPAPPKDESSFRRIGVGVSKSPTGPFKWEKNYIKGISGIDPGLFIDDDNKTYLYFGGGQDLFVSQLKDNMKEIASKPIKIQGLPSGYKEGSFTFKKDGIYYFTFAHVFPQEGYTIGYATSDNPKGPFTYRGKIMDNISNGTNHHSIVNYKGDWILFYHWWDISGYNKLRSIRADYVTFMKDGTIKKVKPTLRGIGTAIIGDTIHMDRHSDIVNAKVDFVGGNEPTGWMVSNTKMKSSVRFNRVNFGKGEATKIKARIACGQRIASFEIYIDKLKGQKIAEFPVEYTGGWNTWKTIETNLLEKTTGIHDIIIVFKSEWNVDKIANLNWIKLE
ncbi:hypothetical protein A8C32_16045 [Flavivirga aquatica]|uniref:CBM6 domain-containing protein n=1 Tax=Flavivirga aquatica TaxID=1849968 RepID=A0A1E5T9B7_9FLAO|nr:family 43 glycosylhydrolase [Flavivirga aquatica]OEK07972.1 hypothetical protein A8C32_16045 [Flavivirga aquatica]